MKSATPHHQGLFVVRLPGRPISNLQSTIQQIIEEPEALPVEHLTKLLEDTSLQEAIYLASPSFYASWQEALQKGTLSQQPKIQQALWRYVLRAYGRSTPFSTFAGVGLGMIDKQTGIDFGPAPWQTQFRLDSRVLKIIVKKVESNPGYRRQLVYSLNNSIYRVRDEYRFSDISGQSGNEQINLASYRVTPELETLVEYLQDNQSASFNELSELYGLDVRDQVVSFLESLIDGTFLVSNLTMPVTGLELSNYLKSQLTNLIPRPPLLKVLSNTSLSPATNLQLLATLIQEELGELGERPTYPVLQADLNFYPARLTIGEELIRKTADQFKRLLPLLTFSRHSPLLNFKQRFVKRFERQEVTLLQALDIETGVGLNLDTLPLYPSLMDLGFSETHQTISKPDSLDTLREVLYSRHVLWGEREVILTEADLNTLTCRTSDLPPAWYLHGELYLGKKTELNEQLDTDSQNGENYFRFALNGMMGASASMLLGRFCHGNADLHQAVLQLCAEEQGHYPNELLAEIVHYPLKPDSAGNVVARPVLRQYEIPYLTPAGVQDCHTISLQDILVSVNEADQLILRHQRTGQRIRPRLSSAHNPQLGDEIYQFLSLVQLDEHESIGWSWRSLSQLPSLPRLVYQNIILYPAQWTIKKESLRSREVVNIDELIADFKLPRYVYLVESDNKLLLDLTFPPAQFILRDEILKQDKIILKEWLGETHKLWLTSSQNEYVSELIIPMSSPVTTSSGESTLLSKRHFQSGNKLKTPQRYYLPGSEWLYVKIYLHETVSDEFLTNVLRPFWQKVQKQTWVMSMFFIRYQDPDYHLRIRFQIKPQKIGQLIRSLHRHVSNYQENGLIHSVQIDTYFPEIERYSPDHLEDCERIFAADTEFILDWLSTQPQPVNETNRYSTAIASVQGLLDDLRLSLAARIGLLQRLQAAFLLEQAPQNALLKRNLNAQYRSRHATYFTPEAIVPALLQKRSAKSVLACTRLNATINQQEANNDRLIASLIHMALNRLFSGQQRRHELVVYHYLVRHYETVMAKTKHNH